MSETGGVYAAALIGPAAGPDLVVVGAASRDVTSEDPRGWRLGGAATYCSLTAARLGLSVGCLVGVDPDASSAPELGLLEAAGVDVRRVRLAHGPVFENIEVGGHRRQRWLSKSDEIPVEVVPEEWRSAVAWLLVPVACELGEEWAGVPGSAASIEVGPQGLLREFHADGWVRRVDPSESAVFRAAGLVCGSVDDFSPTLSTAELRRLAPRAAIVLTGGAGGGVALTGSDARRYAGIPARREVDPTGAGDVFLAALMVAWLVTGKAATSGGLRFAAAAASCSVEAPGLAGVPTRAQVAARLQDAGF